MSTTSNCILHKRLIHNFCQSRKQFFLLKFSPRLWWESKRWAEMQNAGDVKGFDFFTLGKILHLLRFKSLLISKKLPLMLLCFLAWMTQCYYEDYCGFLLKSDFRLFLMWHFEWEKNSFVWWQECWSCKMSRHIPVTWLETLSSWLTLFVWLLGHGIQGSNNVWSNVNGLSDKQTALKTCIRMIGLHSSGIHWRQEFK